METSKSKLFTYLFNSLYTAINWMNNFNFIGFNVFF